LVLGPLAVLASTVSSTTGSAATSLASMVDSLRTAPVVGIPLGPFTVPVPALFQLSTPVTRDLSMAERSARAVNKREYGYQISSTWQVRRRTHYNYINWEPYLSAYMRNRVTEVDVFDALQNTNDADDVLIGKTLYAYDNYAGMSGMENYSGLASPPGHLSSYDTSQTTRGNLTDATTYSDVGAGTSVTHSSKLDIFGGVTKAQVLHKRGKLGSGV
jgi:hypothetical protein